MKKHIRNIMVALREVYAKPAYLLLSLGVILAVFIINIGVMNYQLYRSFPSVRIVKEVFLGSLTSLPWYSLSTVILIALLTAIFITLMGYHVKSMQGALGSYAAGSGGLALGFLAPACASCSIGLIAVLGMSGTLGILPWKGVEITVLGIVLLGGAITSLSRKIAEKTCVSRTRRRA